MTKDNVYVHIDSVIYWHIINPYQATFGITDVRKALIERWVYEREIEGEYVT